MENSLPKGSGKLTLCDGLPIHRPLYRLCFEIFVLDMQLLSSTVHPYCTTGIILIMTRRINISGIIFNVEPVGYEILRAYQDAWKQMNPQSKGQWEEQVAEYLLQQLNGNTTITTTAHIEGMNKVLSEVPFPNANNLGNGGRWGQFFTQIAFGLW